MNDDDVSITQNKPDPNFKVLPPEPLEGEVKAGASHPDQKESISVLANKPEDLEVAAPVVLEGEVVAGASEPDEVPPSVRGTSYAPKEK